LEPVVRVQSKHSTVTALHSASGLSLADVCSVCVLVKRCVILRAGTVPGGYPMRRVLVFVCLLLCGCATDRVHSNYRGADAGDLVYSVAWREPVGFVLFFKKFGQPSYGNEFGVLAGDGAIMVDDGVLGRPMDFRGDGEGQVQIQHLEPGKYEIYTFNITKGWGLGGTQTTMPSKDFSIPFTVEAGKALYIGEFMLVHGPSDSPQFIVSDKHERDIPIAQKQDPNLRPTAISVFDVSQLRNPLLVAGERN
jgi:hypothetical protein